MLSNSLRKSAMSAALACATLGWIAVADAQPFGPGGPRGPNGWGPGMMMGPGMMGPGRFDQMCGPRAVGMAEWRIDRLERIVKPTDAQRTKFDELKAASAKAADAMRSACTTAAAVTVVGRMEAMEKRLEAMLLSVKTMRPALDGFYATLSEEQKAQLNRGAGAGRFWRWRDRW